MTFVVGRPSRRYSGYSRARSSSRVAEFASSGARHPSLKKQTASEDKVKSRNLVEEIDPVVKLKDKHVFKLDAFLSSVDEGRTVLSCRKNETIVHQGDSADAVFYIKNGDCKVSVVSEQGKEAVVALLSEGDFFGEVCLAGQQTYRLATVTAITRCEFMRFDKSAMMRGLREHQGFSEFFISYLLTRNARIEADFVDQLLNPSEKRLARLLLLMAEFSKERDTQPILARVSQSTLAEMIGTTRSRVSYFLNKFRKRGFVELKPLRVHKSLLKGLLHDDPAIGDRVGQSK